MRGLGRSHLPVWIVAAAVMLVVGLLVADWLRGPGSVAPSATPTAVPTATSTSLPTPAPSSAAAVLLAVGDTASCDNTNDSDVAALAAELPGEIALVGDLAYPNGSARDFADCLDPVWGPMRDRLRPAPGNHEYNTRGASAYYAYFGADAGTDGQGWYAYDIGSWRVLVLNSSCDAVGGCGAGSPQLGWLAAQLADAPACTLAYWHHPRWSSGYHGSNDFMAPAWDLLAASGADVVLGGHDHSYERVLADGMREFVVGTGGRSLYPFPGNPLPGTEVRNDQSYGLLRLDLADGSYAWHFLPVGDATFTDTGSASCSP